MDFLLMNKNHYISVGINYFIDSKQSYGSDAACFSGHFSLIF